MKRQFTLFGIVALICGLLATIGTAQTGIQAVKSYLVDSTTGALIGGDATNGLDVDVTRVTGTVTVSDGAGAMNVIVDSGTLTAVTSITNAVTVTDGAGALNVICDSGCSGSGGTALADDADFADGVTSGTPIGGVAESASPTTVTEGDFGWAAITLNRALKVTLYSAAGTEITTGTDYTHDAALTVGTTTGPISMRLAKDFDGAALPNAVSAEGDAVMAASSLSGVQYVMLVSEDGALERGTSTTPMVVGDGSGSLNVIVDSGTITVSDGAGALNVICDSGCSGGTQYAEDTVHASGNTGTLALVVRNDAGTALAADGDNIPLMVNSAGSLYTTVTGTVTVGDGAGALNIIVDSGTLTAVTSITNAVTVTDGSGALNVICDSGCSGGTQYAEDAAHVSAHIGTLSLAVRQSTPANLSDTNGDYEPLQVNAGRLWTSTILTDGTDTALIDGSGNLAVSCSNCSGSGVSVNEDVASADGHPGTPAYSVRQDSIASSTNADGDYQPLKSDSAGRLYVTGAVTNAGTFVVQENGAALTALQLIDDDQTGGTPSPVVSAASNNFTTVKASAGRVLGMYLVNTTATVYYIRFYNDAAMVTGDCASATNWMFSMPIPSNSTSGAGFSMPFPSGGLAFGTGIGYCITGGGSSSDNTSAATGIYGLISYK